MAAFGSRDDEAGDGFAGDVGVDLDGRLCRQVEGRPLVRRVANLERTSGTMTRAPRPPPRSRHARSSSEVRLYFVGGHVSALAVSGVAESCQQVAGSVALWVPP